MTLGFVVVVVAVAFVDNCGQSRVYLRGEAGEAVISSDSTEEMSLTAEN
jgi:hypothetical protein